MCLAASRKPMTVQDVLDDLGTDLAYTTVMTTLSRLHAKHAIDRDDSERPYRYSMPSGVEGAASSMTAHRMHRLLEDGTDRRGVLSRFVADLSPEDEKLLRRLLDKPSSGRRRTT